MFRAYTLNVSGLLLFLVVCLAPAGGSAVAQVRLTQAESIEVTTGTPEYCRHLLHRVSSLAHLATAPVSNEVADLTSEGRQMCENGQTRSGIMRLRRALMLMGKGNRTAYQ